MARASHDDVQKYLGTLIYRYHYRYHLQHHYRPLNFPLYPFTVPSAKLEEIPLRLWVLDRNSCDCVLNGRFKYLRKGSWNILSLSSDNLLASDLNIHVRYTGRRYRNALRSNISEANCMFIIFSMGTNAAV